jgi:hypothetical protein
MELELIKDKVYYKIFDRTYKASTGVYRKDKYTDVAKLAEIQKNIDNIKSEYDIEELVVLKQVHGNEVIDADKADLGKLLEADASVATKKNMALAILTADCVPVLLTSADGDVIGAAHCGWKSAKTNIIRELVAKMQKKNARDIKAIIGPCIQQKSYEVDAEYYRNFTSDEPDCKNLFIPSNRENHYMFDLSGYVKRKLDQENIEILSHSQDDTYSMPGKYPSYRRSVHQNEAYKTNILSTIVIR